MTIDEANILFNNYFHVDNFNDFLDPLLTINSGKLKLDITKFDDYLREKHGNYEKEGQTMFDVIEIHYGKEAKEFIEKLISMLDDYGDWLILKTDN